LARAVPAGGGDPADPARGQIVPRERKHPALEALSDVFPVSYAYDALSRATAIGDIDHRLLLDVCIVGSCILLALGLGAATLRRRTA